MSTVMEAAFEHSGIRVRWESGTRVVSFSYSDDRALTAEAADVIIPVVARWVGDGLPYGILVDASDTVEPGEAWRTRWAAFHRTHADRVRIAVYNVGAFIRGYLLIYSVWSGVPLQCFRNEREARAWLNEPRAIPA